MTFEWDWGYTREILPILGHASLITVQATLLGFVLAALLGLVFAGIWARDRLVVTVSPTRVTLVRGDKTRRIEAELDAVYLDGKELVLRTTDGREIAREKTDLPGRELAAGGDVDRPLDVPQVDGTSAQVRARHHAVEVDHVLEGHHDLQAPDRGRRAAPALGNARAGLERLRAGQARDQIAERNRTQQVADSGGDEEVHGVSGANVKVSSLV